MEAVFSFFSTLAHITTAVGVLVVWQQLRVAKKTMSDDHQRSRLQFAIEITREWNRSVGPETSAAHKLIEELNAEQCRKIANYQTVEVSEAHRHLVEACLGEASPEAEKDGMILLNASAVKQLRYLGVRYLNELEVVLSAWHNEVGDQEYLVNEFKFVNNTMTMIPFRESLTSGVYPAIDAFLAQRASQPKDRQLGNFR